MTAHLDRPIMLDIGKDGTITIRQRNATPFSGGVPVFSTDTIEEAQGLRTFLCTEQDKLHPSMPGERWYTFDGFIGDVTEIPQVTELFIDAYQRLYAKPALAA